MAIFCQASAIQKQSALTDLDGPETNIETHLKEPMSSDSTSRWDFGLDASFTCVLMYQSNTALWSRLIPTIWCGSWSSSCSFAFVHPYPYIKCLSNTTALHHLWAVPRSFPTDTSAARLRNMLQLGHGLSFCQLFTAQDNLCKLETLPNMWPEIWQETSLQFWAVPCGTLYQYYKRKLNVAISF